MSLAVTKRKKSIIVLAWIAPIIAIIISVAMVYDHYNKIGNNLSITFKNIDGLDIRQSHIQYNGLHIGNIDSMKLDTKNINNFVVTATIYSEYNYLVTQGSIFYKVSPKLSLNEVSGLSNVLKGNYIELIPATTNIPKLKSLEKKSIFQGYDSKPRTDGIIFTINSNDGSFGLSSGILFKGLQIGEVINKTINHYDIEYKVLIYKQYQYLISSTTQFYTINPFEFNATLEQIDLKIPSIKNILSSAIGFVTPSYDEDIKTLYTLHPSKDSISSDEADNKHFSFRIKANGISKTDFIMYRGIIVGKIKNVKLETDINEVTGNIYSKYKYLINNSTYFYKLKAVKTQLSTKGLKVEIPAIKELVLGGLSFQTPNKNEKLSSDVFTFYDDLDERNENEKFSITLYPKDNHNIKTTSKLYYKNIEIAEVTKISLDENIKITIQGDKKYKNLFGKNSKIYLEGTQISLEGVKNISSTVLGDKLYLIADKHNNFKSKFSLDSINPDDTHYKKGLRVKLRAINSKNITVDSPIYYKGFEIGKIYDADLVNDGEFIVFKLFIEDKYKNIVKINSEFYKATIIDMDVSLFGGAKIKMGSAKSILRGGIVFKNPISKQKTSIASNGTIFNLLEERNK
jgi:paraquat-inducible protein B